MTKKKQLMISAALVFSVGLITLLIINKDNTDHTTYTFSDTGISQKSMSMYATEDAILTYNGASFTKKDLSSGTTKILSSPGKLPSIRSVWWVGDRGAIVQFDHSFINTSVGAKIKEMGLKVNKFTKDYIWYIDFSSNKISLLDTDNIIGETYYSKETNKAFFLNRRIGGEGVGGSTIALNKIDFSTGKMSLIQDKLPFVAVKSISSCPVGKDICVLGIAKEDTALNKVVSINPNDGDIKDIYKSKNTLVATNKNQLYVLIHQQKDSTRSEADIISGEASLVDIVTRKERPLDFTATSNIFLRIFSDDKFIVLDDSFDNTTKKDGAVVSYRSGYLKKDDGVKTSKLLTAKDGKGSNFSKQILLLLGANNQTILAQLYNDHFAVIQKEGSDSLFTLNINKAKNSVKSCASNTARDWSYDDNRKLFTVNFIEDENFNNAIPLFTKCLDSATSIYSFKINTVDKASGRLTSD